MIWGDWQLGEEAETRLTVFRVHKKNTSARAVFS